MVLSSVSHGSGLGASAKRTIFGVASELLAVAYILAGPGPERPGPPFGLTNTVLWGGLVHAQEGVISAIGVGLDERGTHG
jgi:hypothetical protein